VELAVNCIKVHGAGPDIVMLDPFLGIGHSALAAKRCGVKRFVGFDIEAEYVEVARQGVERGVMSRGRGEKTGKRENGKTSKIGEDRRELNGTGWLF
jgi:DNA modification methylase